MKKSKGKGGTTPKRHPGERKRKKRKTKRKWSGRGNSVSK